MYVLLKVTVVYVLMYVCRVMNGGVFLGNFVKSLMESYDLPVSAMAVCTIFHYMYT